MLVKYEIFVKHFEIIPEQSLWKSDADRFVWIIEYIDIQIISCVLTSKIDSLRDIFDQKTHKMKHF